MHPIEVLERYWNHTSFRIHQKAIIQAVLDKHDTFALLPTGGGKSVCFQIPALMQPGICIVISPLIALMKDQVQQLKSKGIKAIAIPSGIPKNELDTLLDNCIYGSYKFLYLSPERLQQSLVQERLKKMQVNLIAVDEAHCISQWGNDFRPAYKHIEILRQLHPQVNCIALTATARSNVVNDVIKQLHFVSTKIFKGSFERPNIAFKVIHSEDKWYELKTLLIQHTEHAIVYARTRNSTLTIYNFLQQNGFSVSHFHGGLSAKNKQTQLHQWLNNKSKIMVATSAFGMGIDKGNVSQVIHFNLPDSLENYYQEAGRAGRNGKPAEAIILHQKSDSDTVKEQFLSQLPEISFIKHVYKKICNYFQVAYGEGELSTHQLNLVDFCNTYKLPITKTYNVLLILDRNSVISLTRQFTYNTEIQFVISNNALFNYLSTRKHLNTVVTIILRTYGGVFDFKTKINLQTIVKKYNISEALIVKQLQQLKDDGVIHLKLSNSDSEITFLKPREDEHTINPIIKVVKQQQQLKHKQVNAVIAYVNNVSICKSKQLLDYFEEADSKNCGICSVCDTKTSSFTKQEIKQRITTLLKTASLSSRDLKSKIKIEDSELLDALTELLEYKKITITASNTYLLNDNI